MKKKSLFKQVSSLLVISVISSSLCVPLFAAKADEVNELKGTWTRGQVTQDTLPPFHGYITDANGNTTPLDVSPFTDSNIIDNVKMIKILGSTPDLVSPMDYWQGSYYYEYVPNSFTSTVSFADPNHYQVGHTQAYNSTGSVGKLSYSQASSVTSSWSVSAQVSATAEIKQAYFQKLTATLGGSYTTSTTTSSSTTIAYQIDVPSGKTGWINAFTPGGYLSGSAKFKEYLYASATGQFISTGNTVTSDQGGWSPKTNVATLNFTSGNY